MNNRHRLVEKLKRRENRCKLANALREYPSLIADNRYGLSGLTIYNLLMANHVTEMKLAFLERQRIEAEEAFEKYRIFFRAINSAYYDIERRLYYGG